MTCILCHVELAGPGLAVRVAEALCNVALDSCHRDRDTAAEDLILLNRGDKIATDLHEPSVDVTADLAVQLERALLAG